MAGVTDTHTTVLLTVTRAGVLTCPECAQRVRATKAFECTSCGFPRLRPEGHADFCRRPGKRTDELRTWRSMGADHLWREHDLRDVRVLIERVD